MLLSRACIIKVLQESLTRKYFKMTIRVDEFATSIDLEEVTHNESLHGSIMFPTSL